MIQLQLVAKDGRWSVDKDEDRGRRRKHPERDRSFVAPLPAVAETVRAEHQATIDYVKTPIGSSDFAMTSYFADVGDVSAMQIVNMAQTDYVANYVKQTMPQFASRRCSSTASPFKTGFAGAPTSRMSPPVRSRDQQRRRSVPVPEHAVCGEG